MFLCFLIRVLTIIQCVLYTMFHRIWVMLSLDWRQWRLSKIISGQYSPPKISSCVEDVKCQCDATTLNKNCKSCSCPRSKNIISPAYDKNKQKCILNSQITARKSQLSLMTNRLISACEPWHQATLEKIQDTGGKKEKSNLLCQLSFELWSGPICIWSCIHAVIIIVIIIVIGGLIPLTTTH